MTWVDQSSTERDAGSPLDETFWKKWVDRLGSHRNRALPRWGFSEQDASPSTSWTNTAESYEVFIPQWAEFLVFRDYVGIDLLVATGTMFWRYAIGSTPDYSPIASLVLSSLPPPYPPDTPAIGADGYAGQQVQYGFYFVKEIIYEIPSAMRGTPQVCQPQISVDDATDVTDTFYNTNSLFPAWRFEGS